jgi:alkyl sulfatase BDS1-like metallo-beta-lactamase superfamily hydrolase
VKHSVRQIYQGYLGWFQGDPTMLDPLPPLDRAERYVRLMGGRDAVLKEARALKAQALRQLGFQTENTNWRNWYLTSALELEGRVPNISGNRLAAPDILKEMPLCNYVEGMTVRLDPIKSAGAHVTVAFRLSDKGQSCALEVRRGVAQLHDPAPNTGASIVLTSAQLYGALSGAATLAQLVTTPGVVTDADRNTVAQFFSCFDAPANDPIALTVR